MAGAVKIYDDRQKAAVDLNVRRATYVELLAEIQLRVSKLQDADSQLNGFIGTGTNFNEASPLPGSGPRRAAFERKSFDTGKAEADILSGRGKYVPTDPVYANIDLLTLMARLENLGGVPDLYAGSLRLLRVLDAPSDVLWLFVRAYLPLLQDFVIRRHLLHSSGNLPLPAGVELTSEQKKFLGIRNPKPGEMEALQRKNDVLQRRIKDAFTVEKM